MSAVSKWLMPASRAASTTARAASSSMRMPKLLQPRPATETSSEPTLLVMGPKLTASMVALCSAPGYRRRPARSPLRSRVRVRVPGTARGPGTLSLLHGRLRDLQGRVPAQDIRRAPRGQQGQAAGRRARPPSSRRRSTPPSASSPGRSGSPGSGPARRPRRCSRPASARGRAREQALPRLAPRATTPTAVREHDIDVIAAPEIDITEGEEEGDVGLRRRGRGPARRRARAATTACGSRSRAARRPPTRRSTPRSTGCASSFADLEDGRRARGRRRLRSRSTSRASIDDEGIDGAHRRPTTSTRSAPAGSCPSSTSELRGREGRRHPRVRRRPPRPLRRASRPGSRLPGARQGREAQGAPRAHRRVGAEDSEFETVEELRDDLRRRALDAGRARCRPDGPPRQGRSTPLGRAGRHRGCPRRWSTRRSSPPARPRPPPRGPGRRHRRSTSRPPARTRPSVRRRAREGAADQAVQADLALRAVADAEEHRGHRGGARRRDRPARRAGRREARQGAARSRKRSDQLEAVRSDIARGKALDWLVEHVDGRRRGRATRST